jgi:hypothetical protein
MKTRARLFALLCLLSLAACGEDPMEACMKQALAGKAEGSSRGEYIKAREKARLDCERRFN